MTIIRGRAVPISDPDLVDRHRSGGSYWTGGSEKSWLVPTDPLDLKENGLSRKLYT